MRTTLALSITFLLGVSAFGTGDDKPSSDRDTWNGFGVGSWVTRTESFTENDRTESYWEKQTRVENKGSSRTQLQVHREGQARGEMRRRVPAYDPALDPKCKILATNKQDLVIRGRTYSCDVKTYDLTEAGYKATATYWHCKTASVPYRENGWVLAPLAIGSDVLRLDTEYRSARRSEKTSVRVTNTAEERRVGERTITCAYEEASIEFAEGATKVKVAITRALSDEVPGREVELIAEGTQGNIKFRRVMGIDAFEVVKEK